MDQTSKEITSVSDIEIISDEAALIDVASERNGSELHKSGE